MLNAKKIPHALVLLITAISVVLLTVIFIWIYTLLGDLISFYDSKTVTLYSVLSSINYSRFFIIFIFVGLYMFVIDVLIVWGRSSWKKVMHKESEKKKKRLHHFWTHHRTVHIAFILITLFVTISVTAPSIVMNSFTAIVSISVLVSNSIKKLEK